jgi:riboflavin kinase/FMN adenylyltransferase
MHESIKIITWPQFLEEGLPVSGNTAMTIGVFDGVHRGHQSLIRRIKEFNPALAPVVVTFRQNHKKFLLQESQGKEYSGPEYPGDIFSFRQKTASFDKLGLSAALVIEFSDAFRRMPGLEFIRLLREKGRMGFLAVGNNFHCGYQLDTDAAAIREALSKSHIPVEILDVVKGNIAGKPVSSSRIRAAIAGGNLSEAVTLLGHPCILDIGDGDLAGKVLPPPGSYPVLARRNPEDAGVRAEAVIERGKVSAPEGAQYLEFLV